MARPCSGTADGTFNRRADRFDNAYAAHYTAGQLTQVDFPDGRFETYGYDGTSGKLTSVVQHGVGDTVTRSWVLEWNGDKLDRITYPDSTTRVLLLRCGPPYLHDRNGSGWRGRHEPSGRDCLGVHAGRAHPPDMGWGHDLGTTRIPFCTTRGATTIRTSRRSRP